MKLSLKSGQRGFSLLEIMVSVFIILVGLLGLASLQSKALIGEFEAYQRAQALVILADIVETLHANRLTASCFQFTTVQAAGTPYIGNGYDASGFTCTASTAAYNNQAIAAIQRLDNILDGGTEKIGSSELGAMIGARACISYDSSSELVNTAGTTLTGTGEYTVAVVWQGMADLFDLSDTASGQPAINCALAEYTSNSSRRMVTSLVRLADLN